MPMQYQLQALSAMSKNCPRTKANTSCYRNVSPLQMLTSRAHSVPKTQHRGNGSTRTRHSHRSNTSSCLDSKPSMTGRAASIPLTCDVNHATTSIGSSPSFSRISFTIPLDNASLSPPKFTQHHYVRHPFFRASVLLSTTTLSRTCIPLVGSRRPRVSLRFFRTVLLFGAGHNLSNRIHTSCSRR
jgi:hypothetical protein